MTAEGLPPALAATLEGLPTHSGVYLMKDLHGAVLYVGKAQNLRSRVRSYWQKQSGPSAGQHLIRSAIDRVADLEYTLTDSVSEALLLEANLIKRYKPRFNVRLKDDKSYPYLKITGTRGGEAPGQPAAQRYPRVAYYRGAVDRNVEVGFQMLDAVHHFAQRPQHQIRRQHRRQHTQPRDDRRENQATRNQPPCRLRR